MKRIAAHPWLITVLVFSVVGPSAAAADWQMRSDIPYHVYGHAAAALDGKIHLLGGCHTDLDSARYE